MRSHPSSFLCLCSALGLLVRVGADEEDLRCVDTEIGESAQSLLSSVVNVQLKYRKPGEHASTYDNRRLSSTQSGDVSNKASKHNDTSLAALSMHDASQQPQDMQNAQNYREDYVADGDAVQAVVNDAANRAVDRATKADTSRPVEFHSDTRSKADTTVAAVVAAAAAEANTPAEKIQWKPPAPRAGGEKPEPTVAKEDVEDAVKATGTPPPGAAPPEHVLPHQDPVAEKSEEDVISAENVEVVALLKKFHMSFWMDVLLLFLFFGCCCCCLRECCASYREKQIDDAAKERQIVSYDADRLVHLSILLRLFTKGSLCAKGKVWQQVGFFLIMWVVLTMVLLSTIRYASKLDDKSIKTLSSYLNSFMPFFFAMYLNVVFGRWWTMRTAGLGAMWQAVDDMCVILASHCPGEKFEQQRSTLLRYGMLSQALIYQVARKEVDLDDLVKNSLLMPSERHILEEAPGSQPQTVWVWILDLWRKLHTEGHVEWWVVQHAQRLVSEGRRAIKTIFTYVTCQIPFGWVHLMTFMVNITLIVLVMKAAIITAKDVADMQGSPNPCTMDIRDGFSCNSDFHDQVSIFSQVIQLIIVPFLFLAFLEFTNELTNPFGEDPHDFPRHVYMCGMRDENLGFFHVAGKGTLQGGPHALMMS